MRIALGIEYDGASFYGWQRQREVNSVQQEVEQALAKVANQPIELFCAGRTDAGVHATGQVVHFDCSADRDMKAWVMGTNAQLPDQIAVRWAKEVPDDFHARFSATARRYRYVIYNHKYRPAILRAGLSHYHQDLDIALMQQAAPALLGEQDFSAFRAMQCQSNTPFRNVHHLRIARIGDFIVIDIKANAFLHHMVRNITGSLLEIGMGRRPVSWLAELLASKDRNLAAATAKPGGLYLVEVDYPEQFAIPKVALGPLFLPAT
ncbi:tRNA pseudouridine(38-40) synthase TruA [Alishewanella sp. 16-MA]|uniref:tRNA pseudouridine synthase A n=1 Tax=Alishewanella maricola TaxID=2795740 RepID=A0ABS8C0N1_9ALTE|nr:MULTISPECIES: tRNA pseudouridine(38-40) synthase TruA [Gammaproteobacteria]MDP4945396.1 tRNA pseudouridine(38-40) synthase TruA [Alishewanella sp.]MCB5225690.1 tRNA pseudouridine(38-40) synthase TruA [Alishewanella maricola]MCC5451626.1 tRNA pseudouridine(38-40) synthase TruA [Rheinheimera sp. UJ51]MCF4008035.1 tRNA pseudouridine(38-40) synthase TruA [Rheinheimera sp. UJ63]MDP5036126.1 tRNA pseudouridine(38-40) synthase TruA [Alishewanella sp.]